MSKITYTIEQLAAIRIIAQVLGHEWAQAFTDEDFTAFVREYKNLNSDQIAAHTAAMREAGNSAGIEAPELSYTSAGQRIHYTCDCYGNLIVDIRRVAPLTLFHSALIIYVPVVHIEYKHTENEPARCKITLHDVELRHVSLLVNFLSLAKDLLPENIALTTEDKIYKTEGKAGLSKIIEDLSHHFLPNLAADGYWHEGLSPWSLREMLEFVNENRELSYHGGRGPRPATTTVED